MVVLEEIVNVGFFLKGVIMVLGIIMMMVNFKYFDIIFFCYY